MSTMQDSMQDTTAGSAQQPAQQPGQRLAKDIASLKTHYTVVVVGSGYGAGVAASRLARAGQSVCVLERGRELRPGEYPNDLASAAGQVQIDTARGKLGAADGLFNLHMNPDMFAMVGCGLGGTSLINANVALEIDPRLFDLEGWPAEFRQDKTLLHGAYERARQMLDPKPYPETYPTLNKLSALEKSAQTMGQPFYRPPITVNFVDQTNAQGVPQPKCTNCGDCCSGCNVGAKNTTLMNYLPDARNHGAEIFTQLRVDWIERAGTQWRVHFTPNGAGAPGAPGGSSSVLADVVMLGAGSLGSTEILLRSRGKGLGTSDQIGQRFSGNGDVLAFGYDSYWQTTPGKDDSVVPANINGIGVGDNKVDKSQYPGPCITGVIDMRHGDDPAKGLVIEEGVIPGAVATGLPPGLFFADAIYGNFMQYGVGQAKQRLLDAKALGEAFQNDPGSLTQRSYEGPVARTQTYLVMSVDDAGGQLLLQDDRLRIHWPDAGASPVIARDNELINQANMAVQGQFFPNVLWSEPVGKKLITVHPVGGCGMGDDAEHGVVNHKCQVFSGASGTAVHEGLYVCDGAAMPGAVGVNPLLTISAVAERACELLARERGWVIDGTRAAATPLPPASDGDAAGTAPSSSRDAVVAKHRSLIDRIENSMAGVLGTLAVVLAEDLRELIEKLIQALEDGAIDVAKEVLGQIIKDFPDALSPQFQFTETMHGWVSTRPVTSNAPAAQRISDDYEVATAWGRALGTTLTFELTIHSDDMNQVISDPKHPAQITGHVMCTALSDTPMMVREGSFQLLPVDLDSVETWNMNYDLVLERREGLLRFHGFKVLHQATGTHFWTDVTTLFVTLRDGAKGDGPLLAQGTLTLDLEDLTWQGASARAPVQDDWLGHIVDHFPMARDAIAKLYLAKFAGFFGMTLFQAYGGILADMNNFPAQMLAAQPSQRPRRELRLPEPSVDFIDLPDGFRNRLTRYEGGKKGPVLVAPGFSIKASSFTIDTVDENLTESLVAAGYDVWLFDYRASPDSGSPIAPYTVDDIALIDWPAAVSHVLQVTGAQSLQAVSHCISSMSLLMALADGRLPNGAGGVRSLISSQLTLHPVTDWFNYLKADMNVVGLLESVSQLAGAFDFTPGQMADENFDHEIDAVAWNLPVPEGQACKNPTCRRVFAVYGPSYEHAQLNHWTHTTLCEMFGRVSIKPFEQLQAIMKLGHVVDANGKERYVTEQGARNLALPISFISGAANQLFYPETAQRTRDWLTHSNDPALYTLRQFEGYAHMDTFIGRNAAKDVFPYLVSELDRFN